MYILPSLDDSSWFTSPVPMGSVLIALIATHLPQKMCIQYTSSLNNRDLEYVSDGH